MRNTIELIIVFVLAFVIAGLSGLAVTIALYLGDTGLLREATRGVVLVYTGLGVLLINQLPPRK